MAHLEEKLHRGWAQVLVLVLILAFTGMIYGGYIIYQEKPPIPDQVVDDKGAVLYTGDDIRGGQAAFLRYGIMDFGTIFGHGGYLGTDFTADYLHRMGDSIKDHYSKAQYGSSYDTLTPDKKGHIDTFVKLEMKENRVDPATNTLRYTAPQTQAYKELKRYYYQLFTEGKEEWGIAKNQVPGTTDDTSGWHSAKPLAEQLSDYFAWSAWAASANRPGLDYSYTNNWPHDPLVGNTPTQDTIIWSAASAAILLLFLGFILFIYVKYRIEAEPTELKTIPTIENYQLTPSQLKTAKYFLVVAALFVVQTLVGSLSAHYFVEREFFGIPLQNIIPFNLSRTWHLQLAIFWIATSWIGAGIFIAPLVGGKEPKAQGILVDILFVAVVIVAVGSLIGEFLGIKGWLNDLWFWLGNQGWEYVELGRLWQILLIVGLVIWLFIVYRALRHRLNVEDSWSSLSHLLLYSAVSIPAFYAFGLFYNPNSHFTVADFWRWFIIHLWVESFFEFFAVVATAYILVSLGLVTRKSATRSVYFTLILVLGAGIEGIGHHYWWIGSPAAWIGIGAVFSALEVIPLTLLVFDAVGNININKKLGKGFHYRSTINFLVAAAIWNFVGAGVLGFLINLPIVSYYEHGTYLTPTHGHGSMMGTYGMLGIAMMMFALRTITRSEVWNEKRIKWSFLALNTGLVLMLILNLLPVGFLQLAGVFQKGVWYARSFEFLNSPLFLGFTWARIVGDVLFIAGAVILFFEVFRYSRNLRDAKIKEGQNPKPLSQLTSE